MNNWNFTGNLGRDGELRFLPNGDPVLSFSVGVRSGYGEKASTTWANCVLFGKRSQSLEPYMKKGQQVAVSGEVNNRAWTDKEGQQRWTLDVRVANVDLIGSKPEPHVETAAKPDNGTGFDDMDDDLPF